MRCPEHAREGADLVAEIEPIVGRYVLLTINGKSNRVYFEEAGKGIPLVCLHTAGSDNRQFRHMMLDAEITEHFRVLAFDMPWHGKSFPSAGWQDEEYRLTTKGYAEIVMTFCRTLDLEPPVVMGCSIGGRIVLYLAGEYARELRAVIGLESADYQQPWYDSTWLHHPEINGGEYCGAHVSGYMAPQSPSESRWETIWGYMQGGPGVLKGDVQFYRSESDIRDRIALIDTRICPVYLLTGEYDYSCTPEDTRKTAQRIPGAEVIIMKELGHFPMAENPEQFRRYILPVLKKIRTRE